MADRDVVFYCVVDTRFYLRDPSPLFETNVESLRRVLDVASQADLFRFVFCSTIGTIAIAKPGESATEDMPFNWEGIGGPYIESRRQAEDMVLDYAGTAACPPSPCVCPTLRPARLAAEPGADDQGGGAGQRCRHT